MKSPDTPRVPLAWSLALPVILALPSAGSALAQEHQITSAAASLYNEATAMIGEGSLGEALQKLEKVIRLEPEFARGHFDLGFVKEQMGDFASAAESYATAAGLDGANADYPYAAGKAQYLAQDFEAALVSLQSALAIDGANARVWLQIARTQQKLGALDEASASALKATELDSTGADAFYELGSIEYDRNKQSKVYDLAIRAYTRALELDSDHANAHAAQFKLGRMYYRQKEYAKAEAHYLKATELRPDYAPGFVVLGDARNRLKDYEAAIAAYEQAIAVKAPTPYGMAHYNLGRVHWAQEDAESAIAAYRQALEDPQFKHADKARQAIASIEEYLAKKKRAGGVY